MYTGIVDPLDGTTNFLHSIPQFAISVALEREDTIVAGLIYNPANDEMFTAERGKGAFLNDRRIRVAARPRLSEAVVGCGLPHLGGATSRCSTEFAAVQDKVAGLRRFGAAASISRGLRPAARRFLGTPTRLGTWRQAY